MTARSAAPRRPARAPARAQGGRGRATARPGRSPASRPGSARGEATATAPHGRLGILWAIPTAAALVAGATWLALWLAVAAALAAASLVHSWSHGAGRRSNGKPARPARARSGPRSWPPMELAAVLSAAVVLASIAGPIPAAAAAVVVGGFLGRPAAGPARRAPGPARGALIVLAPAAAAAGVVITRAHNLTSAVVLVAMGWAYDASAYVVGTGARHRWAGPLAGMASIAAVSLFVAAVLAPPFRGTAPWVMGAMAAVLAPLGPPLVARLHRPPTGPLPGAAGRLDSLVLLAPAWAAASALLLKS